MAFTTAARRHPTRPPGRAESVSTLAHRRSPRTGRWRRCHPVCPSGTSLRARRVRAHAPVHHPQGWPQRWPGRARQRCDRRDRQRRPAARRPLRAGDRRLREGAVALVRGLGADRVIDRDTADFTKDDHHFDVVFDAVGKSSFRRCRPVLKPRSLYLTTARPSCRRQADGRIGGCRPDRRRSRWRDCIPRSPGSSCGSSPAREGTLWYQR